MRTTPPFTPPGPGAWELETTHFSRPVTRFTQETMTGGFVRGFAAGTARYGAMLSHLEPAFVNGFIYMKPVAFGAPKDAEGPPPKLVLQLLTRLMPKMRRRIQTAHDAIVHKLWRQDLARWDLQVKPAAIARHRELQSVDLAALDDAGLVAHVREAHRHLEAMVQQHHEFTATTVVPVGDFLVHVQAWTGRPAGEILNVLRGSSGISLGVAQEELAALAAAVTASPTARALLDSAQPAQAVLDALLAHDATAAALRAYLDLVQVRCLGYDLGSRSMGEMPELIVRAIQGSLDGRGTQRDDPAAAQARIQALRGVVPAEHRAAFDALLAEVLLINRLRDERGHYSDGWAAGIARRALLECGRRLVARGVLSDAELAVEASLDDVVALLEGAAAPGESELAARAAWRRDKTTADADVPPWLGAPPGSPPPTEWLPEKGRRMDRALGAFMQIMFVQPVSSGSMSVLKGLAVNQGVCEGPARLVSREEDFGRIQQGDILVTQATSPYFNVILPLLGGIVTDRGGQLCHAAIVAREYGIPGIVGTKDATRVIRDGARVRVDGGSGEVTVLA